MSLEGAGGIWVRKDENKDKLAGEVRWGDGPDLWKNLSEVSYKRLCEAGDPISALPGTPLCCRTRKHLAKPFPLSDMMALGSHLQASSQL